MARRIGAMTTLSPTATGDGANLVDNTYPLILQGGSSTQLVRVYEIFFGGQAPSSSSPTIMLCSRDSQIGTGSATFGSGGTDAAVDPATAALAAPTLSANQWATQKPQRSSTLHLMNCTVNAFGGQFLWRANKVEECPAILGNTASLGEMSFSAFTGGTPGLLGSHVIYEAL